MSSWAGFSSLEKGLTVSRGAEDLSQEEYQDTKRKITQKAKLRTDRRWPEKIVANLTAETLDGFIYQNVVAARLVMEFRAQGQGLLVVRDFDEENAAAREVVTAVNLPFHKVIRMPSAPDGLLPIDWFDEGVGPPVMSENPEWREGGWIGSELLLMPQMLDFDAVTASRFGALGPVFRMPREMKQKARQRLEARGIAKDDWFAVIDLNDGETSLALAEKIIGQHGGKALLRQQPAQDRPYMEGIFTIPAEEDDFEFRMAAIALARMFIGGDRYETTLASVFATPCAFVEGIAYERRVWNEGDIVLKGAGSPDKICRIVENLLGQSPVKTLGEETELSVRRGEVEAIPLTWPTSEPVVQFVD